MFDTKNYRSEIFDYYEDVIEDIEQYEEDGHIADDLEAIGIETPKKSKGQDFGNDTLLQIYFTEVGKIYDANDNNYDIEYCPENREKIIQMNLKTVISIAKRFVGCGLSYEDLIGIGNIGLCVAFDHYNPNKNNAKTKLLADLDKIHGDVVRYSELRAIFTKYYTYGSVLERFNKRFTDDKEEYTKTEIVAFINKYIKNAKFNSVASMWIIAYITNALSTQSRLIRRTAAMLRDEKEGKLQPITIVNIDTRVGDGNKTTLQELIPDEQSSDELRTKEDTRLVNSTIQTLMDGLSVRDKRILCYRYGIGLPRSMSPREISKREDLSVARVSQIIQTAVQHMKDRYKELADYIDVDEVMSCFCEEE